MHSVSKIAVASLLSLSLLASFANAQAKKGPAGFIDDVKSAIAKLATPLNDEQKTKIDAIATEAEKEAEKLAAENKAAGKKRTDEEKKAAQTKRQELAKKFRADVDAVLTAEQKKELKAAIAEARKAAKDNKVEKADKPADPMN